MFARTKIYKGVLLALGAGAVVASLPALAQQETSTVVITGSRILKSDLAGTTPVVSVSLDQMGNLGIENFADIATQLPQFAPSFGASRTQSTFSGVATSGLNLANLRNLGSARSLVLINGRRLAGGTSTSSAVDFNNIPTANIDRIEIITGGASAVYGSDAVAGVINIITKKRFEGVEATLSYGEASAGDNKNPSASIVFGGKLGDRGRGLMTLEFDKQGQVSCRDRYICAEDFLWTAPATANRSPTARSGVGLGGRFFVGGASFTRRGDNFLDANGALVPFVTATDGYNRNADRDIAIPTKRIMAASELEFEITKGVRAFAEVNVGETRIEAKFEGHPFQSNQPGSRFGTLNPNIPLNNPFIPAALTTAVNDFNALPANANAQLTEIVWWQRFNDTGGPRGADSSRRMYRTVVGLAGEFASLGGFGRNFRWEASHTLGRTTVNLNTKGLVSTSNLYHGLRVEQVPGAAAGTYRCIDAGARAQGCVPLNPFAPYTQAMRDSLSIGSMAIGTSSLNDSIVSLTGTLFDLPAGAVRAAVGLERKSFSGFLDRDLVVNNALGTGNQISDTAFAKTTTDETFAEVYVPVLADLPGVRSLNLEGAVRQSKTDKTSYNTWNIGGDWEPVDGVRIRAKQARSVRAPLPGELSGIGQTFGVVLDPCTQARRTLNPTRDANCLAAGVPANYVPPQTVEQGVSGLSGGNPNLNPEKGDTTTFGIVFTPKAVKGLSVALDRFDLDITDIITTVSRQDAANLCYDKGLLCNVITRGANVQIPGAQYVLLSVNEQLENVAKLRVSGVDLDVRYNTALPAGFGDLDLGLLATLYDKAKQDTAGTEINLLGQAGGSTSDQGWVRFTANANIGWSFKGFKVNWNLRHIGETNMTNAATAGGFPRVPAHTYHNLRFGYQLSKNAELSFGITNVADKQPPFFASGTSGTQALDTIPGYYDVFGRSYFGSIKVRF